MMHLLEFVLAAVAVVMMVTCCGRCCDESTSAAELRRQDRLESRGRQVAISDFSARRAPTGPYTPLPKKLGSQGQLD